ncbi:MAG: hypothetical protein IJN29_03295 [Akkermansia sp.]|nr:hypothetical protein [Akkermansia sp.]
MNTNNGTLAKPLSKHATSQNTTSEKKEAVLSTTSFSSPKEAEVRKTIDATRYSPFSSPLAEEKEKEEFEYTKRISNTQLQFAWTAIILSLLWVFLIIFIVISQGTSKLHTSFLCTTLCGFLGCAISAACISGLCMTIHVIALNFRNKPSLEAISKSCRYASSHMSMLVAPLIGIWCYHSFYKEITKYSQDLPFHLSETTLITLITSTTVSVLGILGAVMFWLFPRATQK